MKIKKQILALIIITCQITMLFTMLPAKVDAATDTLKKRLNNSVVICTNSSKAFVNNKQVWVNSSNPLSVPVVDDKTTLIPMTFAATTFKADMKLNKKSNVITVKYGRKTCKLKLGSKNMSMNGKNIKLSEPARKIRGEIYIPMQGIVDKVFGKKIFTYFNVKVIGNKAKPFSVNTDKRLLKDLTNLFDETQLSKKTVYSDKVQALVPESFTRMDQNEIKAEFAGEDLPDSAYTNDSANAMLAFYYSDDVKVDKGMINDLIKDIAINKNKSDYLESSDKLLSTSIKETNRTTVGYYEVISKNSDGKVYSLNLYTVVNNRLFYCTFACEKKDMNKWQNAARRIADSVSVGKFSVAEASPDVEGVKLGYKVTDALMDSKDTYLYITDKENKKLHKVNYLTGEEASISFDFSPERMAVDDKCLYVTLVKKPHSPYTSDEKQDGAVAIIDLNTFKIKGQFDVATDPYGIAVSRDGYLYLSSGSGQITTLKSYSLKSKQEMHSTWIDDADIIAMHPTLDRIYSFTSGVSPMDTYAFNVKNGNFIDGGYDSPYHGGYSMSANFKISADGKYLFNNAGTIFGCSNATDYDMKYITKLDASFTSITFVTDKNTFFTSASGKVINQYDYSTFRKLKSYAIQGEGQYIFYKDPKIVAISKTANNSYFIEALGVTDLGSSTTSDGNGTGTTGDTTGNNNTYLIPANAAISDTFMDPEQPIMYAADAANSKIYAINYGTNTKTELSLNLPPERIAYKNGKLYVTLLKHGHSSYVFDGDQSGGVAIIDAQSMSLISQFDIDIDPFDIEVDKDGYIYISSGSGQWTSVKVYSGLTKQELDSAFIREQSYIILNPVTSKLYAIDTDISPRDIEAFVIKDSEFVGNGHDSPYHGDYAMDINMRISPDSKYIFNGAGTIFSCSSDQNLDMRYVSKLNKGFVDIAFDLENDRFYTALKGKYIYSYQYSTFAGVSTYRSKGEVKYLYYRNGELIAMSLSEENRYFIEKIEME
ncbi:MAG TPA: hypothetical protein GXX75_20160 [Clostridiales bacterium]|nr:hypothetical protein [Clostridiales bacterium]